MKIGSVYKFIPAVILLVGGLYYLSLFNYLFYHTLIEFLGVIVAFTIFVIGWSTRKFSRNNMIIILAAGYLVVGTIDLLHTITFSGMGIFPHYGSNVPTQFWVAARYVEAAAFLAAALFLEGRKEIRPGAWLCGFLVAGIILVYAVFAGFFPDSFVEGRGLTTFKIASEYVISATFVAAGIIFWKKRAYLEKRILRLLLLAGAFTVLSEMSFTLYVDVYGFFNFLGHIFKLFSLALIFRALIYESLANPFQFLFREIAETNEKLGYSEKKFRDLVEQSSDWVWEVDREGKITYSNPRARELTGYEADEILGRVPFDFMANEEAAKGKAEYLEAVERSAPFYYFESVLLHKKGYPLVFETSGTPIINEHGELTGYRGISRDITARKKMVQELKQAREEAEQANRAKSVFLANMSHEIRTPMNVIMGMTGILCDSELSRDQRELVETIKEASDSLMVMINDLLDFSKLEDGRLELAKIPFDLKGKVESVVSSYAALAGDKDLQLSCSIAPDVPKVVIGDPARVQEVLGNLVDNAFKFTERGEVAVSLERASNGEKEEEGGGRDCGNTVPVSFFVSDTGIGVSPEQAKNLFQSFTQADVSSTRKYEGTGLGLALAKNLVELMGGSIGVKNKGDRGSIFYFTIPFTLPRESEEKVGVFSPVERETSAPADVGEEARPPEDVREMLQRVDQNKELLGELLEMLFHDYYLEREELWGALEKQDASTLAVVAHGLKGELGNLGMNKAYKISFRIEQLAKENNLDEAAVLAKELDNEIKRLENFFYSSEWQERL